jgi:hypothetical protein
MLKTDEKMGPVSSCAACLLCGSRLHTADRRMNFIVNLLFYESYDDIIFSYHCIARKVNLLWIVIESYMTYCIYMCVALFL